MHAFPKQMQKTKAYNTFLRLFFSKVFYYANKKQNTLEKFLSEFYAWEDM